MILKMFCFFLFCMIEEKFFTFTFFFTHVHLFMENKNWLLKLVSITFNVTQYYVQIFALNNKKNIVKNYVILVHINEEENKNIKQHDQQSLQYCFGI